MANDSNRKLLANIDQPPRHIQLADRALLAELTPASLRALIAIAGSVRTLVRGGELVLSRADAFMEFLHSS
jgi:hypothetical protein